MNILFYLIIALSIVLSSCSKPKSIAVANNSADQEISIADGDSIVVGSQRVKLPLDADTEVRLWACVDGGGGLVFDGENCGGRQPIRDIHDLVNKKFPNYKILGIERGKEFYYSKLWTVYYVTLKKQEKEKM